MYVHMMLADNPPDKYDVINAIYSQFRESRFELEVFIKTDNRRRVTLGIRQVRLKDAFKKGYCGNHAESCDIQGYINRGIDGKRDGTFRPAGRRMKSSKLLEGLDWVDFNDQLNDVLDRLNIVAKVESTYVPLLIRDGARRRICYDSEMRDTGALVEYEWVAVGAHCDYEDYRGRIAPPSEYPIGTPGLYTRKENSNA